MQSTRFNETITHGFCDANGDCNEAVCLLPGTELAFDEPIASIGLQLSYFEPTYHNTNVGKFVQVDIDNPYAHHDAIELVSGEIIKVHNLVQGQICSVLQLPVTEKVSVTEKTEELELMSI